MTTSDETPTNGVNFKLEMCRNISLSFLVMATKPPYTERKKDQTADAHDFQVPSGLKNFRALCSSEST